MIALVAPCITNHDRHYMAQRIHNGLLETDTEVRKYEEAFAAAVGCAGAVAVCSGTTAIQLALELIEHPTPLNIPTYACIAIRNAAPDNVTYLDSSFDVPTAQMALPLFDGDAIVPAMFGQPTQIPVENDRGDSDANIVEDWTLSLGGIPKLSEGRTGVSSTHWSKMISTGRGGILFSNNQNTLAQARHLAYYDTHTDHALSVAMSSTQAALGNSQLDQLQAFIDRRQQIASHYSQRFAAAGIECPNPDCGSVFFRYLIGTTNPADKVLDLAEQGIEAGRGVNPLLHQLAGLPDDDYHGAMTAWNTLLSIPCHPSLTDRQVTLISEQVLQTCAP